MYGKLFEQMYYGTLTTKGPWQALVTFQQFIILADKNGHVEMTPESMSRLTTIPLEVFQIGIEALEQPDPESRTPDEEGRRIVRLADNRTWGWRIVNHAFYRAMRSNDERREYMKQFMRERRAGSKAGESSDDGKGASAGDTAGNGQGAPPASKPKPGAEWNEEFEIVWPVYPKRAGTASKADALKAYRARRKAEVPFEELLNGTKRYAAFCDATGKTGSEKVMEPRRFYGTGDHYKNAYTIPAGSSPSTGSDLHKKATRTWKLIVESGVRVAPSPTARAEIIQSLVTEGRIGDGDGFLFFLQTLDNQLLDRLSAMGDNAGCINHVAERLTAFKTGQPILSVA